MSLVIFTAIIGMYLAPGSINPAIAIISIFCISIGSGASGAINMWYDRDIDQLMQRTAKRPIPAGKVLASDALGLGIVLSVMSVLVLGLASNWVAATLLAVAIAFYVFIYTMWLKRSTVQNIVIGGAAGALPPTIGWACVSGDVSVNSVILFMLIFLWTPPHFWALSIAIKDEYKNAGVPMLPVVKGIDSTLKHIIIYTIIMCVFAYAPVYTGLAGNVYLIVMSLLNIWFMVEVIRLYKNPLKPQAMRTFKVSILYLFTQFLVLVVDRVVYI